jgi:hypothetical protein
MRRWVEDGGLLRCAPSARFPFDDGLLLLDGDGSKVQGMDVGLDRGLVFFYFSKLIFDVSLLNQPTI